MKMWYLASLPHIYPSIFTFLRHILQGVHFFVQWHKRPPLCLEVAINVAGTLPHLRAFKRTWPYFGVQLKRICLSES